MVGRTPSEISLIGVSKTRTAEEVVAAVTAGLHDFGENRVQEAMEKKRRVQSLLARNTLDTGKIRWHLIGRLQSNKVSKAVEIFDVIHSIDSGDLARMVGRASARMGKMIDCYAQVNVSGEGSKSGVTIAEAEALAVEIAAQTSLRFVGFMTIGPLTKDQAVIESCFSELRSLRDQLGASHPEWGSPGLSMGMSDDYELAIACGSTAVRIGTALFGARNYSPPAGIV